MSSGTITLRLARPEERAPLEALQWAASLNNPGDHDALKAHPDAIELPEAQIAAGGVFVAERDGTLLGFAAILPREDGETELDGLFVHPDAQRAGIGRMLVEYSVAAARSAGSRWMHVIGNPHAEQFYLSCGFVMTGTFQTQFGPGLLMRRPIAPAL